MSGADLHPTLAAAIEREVDRAGGTPVDAHDLGEVWKRVARDTERRAAAIRTAVRLQPCGCPDGGDPEDGRCGRCFGRLEERRR
jgi:hypothetical protein